MEGGLKRGQIVEAVKSENRTAVLASLILTLLVGAVLALNWKYLYNWVRGPFLFDAALAAAPGNREFVRAEGTLLSTGVVQESTLRLFRGAVESKSVSANYMALVGAGHLLVVKVAPEFSGRVVEGRLVPLPEALRAKLPSGSTGGSTDSAQAAFHPYLLEQTAHGWLDANLFVIVAVPLFPLCLLLLSFTAVSALRVESHGSLKRLARLGPLAVMLPKVESALAAAGPGARVGSFWVTRDWMVRLDPTVLIYPRSELMGAGVAPKESKSRGTVKVSHSLHFWPRGAFMADTAEVSATEARSVLDAIGRFFPWAIVEDVPGYEGSWARDRAACEREADERRRAAGAAATSPTEAPRAK